MPRVLHIIISLDPADGGTVEGVVQLGQAWHKLGIAQDVLTFDPPQSPHAARYPGKVHMIGVARQGRLAQFIPDPEAVRRVREIAAGYDAVLVSGLWDPAAVVARYALPGTGKPYFVFTHGALDPWFRASYPLKHLFKQLSWPLTQAPLLAGAERVLFTTKAEQQRANRQFLPWRVNGAIVGYGIAAPPSDPAVQIPAFRAALRELGDRGFLLFLSRIHQVKGCDNLIEGFARNAGRYSGDLVIAGSGEPALLRELRRRAAALGVAERVHFIGMLAGDAKWGAFHACDAFVLTSHTESFGVAVVEAMACGKPVLITDQVRISQEIGEAAAGLIAPDTADGAADLVRRFVALHPDDRATMGDRAQQCFHDRFEVMHYARRLADVVLANPGWL
jgi:glycosyltransferase involved in cell wall biosynthesis